MACHMTHSTCNGVTNVKTAIFCCFTMRVCFYIFNGASVCMHFICVTSFMFILSNKTPGDESDTQSWSSKEKKQFQSVIPIYNHRTKQTKQNSAVLPVFPQLSLPSTTSFALSIFRTDSDMITVNNIISEQHSERQSEAK